MARRGPRRVTVTIPPRLAPALEALARLEGRPAEQVVRAVVCATLAQAEREPVVQAAMRNGRRGGLHLVGTRP